MQNSFFIKTLGCKVNQYESQAMREILLRSGFEEAPTQELADIYILNTCTVTHHADKESRYLIKAFHRKNPKAQIAVTGCYVDDGASKILDMAGVSYVLRNDRKSRIAEMLSGDGMGFETEQLKITDFKDHTKAFVKIQEGCENACAYCKVPLVRPTLESKPIQDIIEEVGGLVDKGFREIVLTGICLGAWGKDLSSAASLMDVLKVLDGMEGDFRIRLSSIEPKYVTDELIEFVAGSKKICRHLHIPLQSGDDDILRRMNRTYTAKDYKRFVDKMRTLSKDFSLTTDAIVGFPGESDRHFANTVAFIRAIRPLKVHIFTFSKREGTAACSMQDVVSPALAKRRYERLADESGHLSYLFRKTFLGKRLDVLVEGQRDKATGLLEGYSDNYIRLLFKGPDSIMKRIVPVTVKEVTPQETFGSYEPA